MLLNVDTNKADMNPPPYSLQEWLADKDFAMVPDATRGTLRASAVECQLPGAMAA